MKKLCLFCLFLIVFFSFNHLTYAGSWVGGSATSMAGARNYQLWVPEGYRGGKPLPLVMMLHGCSQTAVDFAAGTQMHLLGDQFNFFVVYPEQPSSANGTNCWNWFLPEHQSRDTGEPSILAGVIEKLSPNTACAQAVFMSPGCRLEQQCRLLWASLTLRFSQLSVPQRG